MELIVHISVVITIPCTITCSTHACIVLDLARLLTFKPWSTLILLTELQPGHLQAHLSSWVPGRSRFTILMSLPGPHTLHDILFAKRWRLCSQAMVFILPSADELVNICSASTERLISLTKMTQPPWNMYFCKQFRARFREKKPRRELLYYSRAAIAIRIASRNMHVTCFFKLIIRTCYYHFLEVHTHEINIINSLCTLSQTKLDK